MADEVRWGGLLTLIAAAFSMAGCATIGVRGQTQSASLAEEPPYQRPYYSGSRHIEPVRPRRETPYSEPWDRKDAPGYGNATPYELRDSYRRPEPRDRNATGGPRQYGDPGRDVRYFSSDLPAQGETAGRSAAAPPVWRSASIDRSPSESFPDKRSDDAVVRPVTVPRPSLRESAVTTQPVQTRSVPTMTVPTPALVPRNDGAPGLDYVRTGTARWMGASWVGHKTSLGEIFDPRRLTAAHATLPIPSFLYVTNRSNGRTVMVRVNDRVPASNEHVVIVSELAARLLGFIEAGQGEVDLQYGGPASREPNAKHEEVFLKQQPWFHRGLLRDTNSGGPTAGRDSPGKSVVGVVVGDAGRDEGGSTQHAQYPLKPYETPTYPRWDNTRR